jgi:NADH-quinone oxidoreductase subunit N
VSFVCFVVNTLISPLAADLARFAPELTVAGGVVVLLLIRLFPRFDRTPLGPVTAMVAAAALAILALRWPTSAVGDASFTGLIALDPLACYVRGVVLLAALGVLVLSCVTGMPDAGDSADFGVLLLGGTLGMLLMASANHLLMMFLAVEMASLPSYALAGFRRGSRAGSEAALKYVVYGAAASGVMLYGISLLAGSFGTGHLPAVAAGFGRAAVAADGLPPTATAGLVLVLVGLGFKLAIVPVHFWLPDVFAGATAEVGAFLSVASKAAAVGLLVRLLMTLQDGVVEAGAEPTLLPRTVGAGLAVAAGLTATFGNLAALPQTDLKRLLAYSTIAHAGYMLMGLATFTRAGVAAVLFYLGAYLLMNLGAFAVVAVVRARTGSETVDACRGLISRSPAVGVGLAACLLGLLGLPPLAGFAGKFQVFAAVLDAGRHWADAGVPGIGTGFAVLLGVGVVNTVVSAGYYLKVLRAAGLDDPPEGAGSLGESWAAAGLVGALAAGLALVGVWWGPLAGLAARAAGG